jgi:YVTN family beta-propeller protein
MRRLVGNWCVKEMTISGDVYLETKGVVDMLAKRFWMLGSGQLVVVLFSGVLAVCQTPSPALLVLEKEDKSLAIVDPATLKIVERVPAGEDPHEVVVNPDGSRAYISNYGGFKTPQKTLSVVDLSSQKSLSPVDLGPLKAPHGLDLVNDKVYFTAEGSKVIGCYDPATNQVEWVVGTGQGRTHMLKVLPDPGAIFTASMTSNTITVFEHDKNADASGWTETNIPVSTAPEGFDVSPDGKELWAASHQELVTIVDIATKKVIQTINLHTKFANRLKFTPDGKHVLISDLGNGDLILVDAASRNEVKRVSLGRGVAGILVAPDGSVAYVAVSPDSNVAVVDLKTFSVTGRIATGKGPDGLAWAVRK